MRIEIKTSLGLGLEQNKWSRRTLQLINFFHNLDQRGGHNVSNFSQIHNSLHCPRGGGQDYYGLFPKFCDIFSFQCFSYQLYTIGNRYTLHTLLQSTCLILNATNYILHKKDSRQNTTFCIQHAICYMQNAACYVLNARCCMLHTTRYQL